MIGDSVLELLKLGFVTYRYYERYGVVLCEKGLAQSLTKGLATNDFEYYGFCFEEKAQIIHC